jgi:hypothetical protein
VTDDFWKRLDFVPERRRQAHVTVDGASFVPTRRRCSECGVQSLEPALGWQAHLTDGEHGPEEAVFFCPDCARKEAND